MEKIFKFHGKITGLSYGEGTMVKVRFDCTVYAIKEVFNIGFNEPKMLPSGASLCFTYCGPVQLSKLDHQCFGFDDKVACSTHGVGVMIEDLFVGDTIDVYISCHKRADAKLVEDEIVVALCEKRVLKSTSVFINEADTMAQMELI